MALDSFSGLFMRQAPCALNVFKVVVKVSRCEEELNHVPSALRASSQASAEVLQFVPWALSPWRGKEATRGAPQGYSKVIASPRANHQDVVGLAAGDSLGMCMLNSGGRR